MMLISTAPCNHDTVRIPLGHSPDRKVDASWDALVNKTESLSRQAPSHQLERPNFIPGGV